jgi:transposase
MDWRDRRIAELEATVAERDERIAELKAVVAAGNARIRQLEVELAARDERIDKLERLVAELSRRLNENSGNSHRPPSSDGPGARGKRKAEDEKKDRSQTEARRKQGGQSGHRGHHRGLLPPEQVDRVVDHFPAVCDDCGADLPKQEDSDPLRIQTTEVPPIRPEVIEDRYHAVTCGCGCTTRVKPASTSPFGPRLMALIVLFTGVYHLSRRRAAAILGDVLGVTISVGAVSTVEGRASEALKSAADEAWHVVDQAEVKYADATTWLHKGVTRQLWVLASSLATVFRVVVDGSAVAIKPFFGACKGILVSDRGTVFVSLWRMKLRQICWAHLLRKFVSFCERDGPAKQVGKEMLGLTGLLFDYWHAYKDGKLSKKELLAWMAPVCAQVEACLERAAAAGIEHVSGSCADILAHREALWTFLAHAGVEPTNNHSEQEIRDFVLWRKRSFGAQSERGHRYAERVMTVAHTARKQNKNVFTFLTACCGTHLTNAACPSLFATELAA